MTHTIIAVGGKKVKRCLNCMENCMDDDNVCPVCGSQNLGCEQDMRKNMLHGRYLLGTERSQNPREKLFLGWDTLFERKVFVRKSDDYINKTEKALLLKNWENSIRLDEVTEILKVLSAFEEDEGVFQILEYPGDRTLFNVLEEIDSLPFKKVEKMVEKMVYALYNAHEIGVFHGQIMPECCYLTLYGKLALMGFKGGSAKEDVKALSSLAVCCLIGLDKWKNGEEQEKIDILEARCPSEWFEVLYRILWEQQVPNNLRSFANLLNGAATMEIK
ncbi:serine/threonine protein kinase [Clostridium sp. CAG:43]|nr:serine/threonine protein kinase [Clostridium sp. CAG:43]